MATAPTAAQQPSIRELFGLTLKHAAVIFAVIYGIGFLVLSIHHARFGMEMTEPFKPKVFSAGILFVVLAGVPCVAMARSLHMFGLRKARTYIVEGKGKAFIGLTKVLDFWVIAVGLRFATSDLFVGDDLFSRSPGLWVVSIYLAALFIALVWLADLNRSPVRTVILSLLLFALGVAAVFKYNSHELFVQVVWFYSVGLAFLWLHSLRNLMPEMATTLDWERQGFAVLGIVAFFAVSVYGHIRSGYGGGAPVRIDMTFARPTSFSSNKTDGGFLMDQDSEGYYIVQARTDAPPVPAQAMPIATLPASRRTGR
jgi:hypothetical protein